MNADRATAEPIASLSLDLDNEWSYLKTHGDAAWAAMPSYLSIVVPRVLAFLAARGLTITFFVVGHDAASPRDRDLIGAISAAGHEVANHSFSHEPWLHTQLAGVVESEIVRAEEAIAAATGRAPAGFRGPGYSLGPTILRVLAERGYAYDASSLPTWVGPVARRIYFRSTSLSAAERHERRELFGHLRDGVRPLRPYCWDTRPSPLLELPVSTFPGLRIPVHFSYLLTLAERQPALADAYFAAALRACRLAGVGPSILLHPLDFLDATDTPSLGFFPALRLDADRKAELIDGWIRRLRQAFTVTTVGAHAASLDPAELARVEPGRLRSRRPIHAP